MHLAFCGSDCLVCMWLVIMYFFSSNSYILSLLIFSKQAGNLIWIIICQHFLSFWCWSTSHVQACLLHFFLLLSMEFKDILGEMIGFGFFFLLLHPFFRSYLRNCCSWRLFLMLTVISVVRFCASVYLFTFFFFSHWSTIIRLVQI